MINNAINDSACLRYLQLLELGIEKPSYKFLSDIVKAHLMNVPFENISKLYYKKNLGLRFIPDLERYLDGIELYNFGGTCYSNNYYLYLLLEYLGFDIKLCGADMNNPDVHVVSIVSIDGSEYIVDVGYAAPFYKPLPRNLKDDYEITWGNDGFVVVPQNTECHTAIKQYRNGEHIYGYTVKPTPRQFDYFTDVIEDSFTEESAFMKSLLVIKFYPGYSVSVRNSKLIKSDFNGEKVEELPDRDTIIDTISQRFNIPVDIVNEAVGMLGDFGDPYG